MLLVTVGAINKPALEIDPELVDQFTAVSLVPCTLAVNCSVVPEETLTAAGETVTLIAVEVVTAELIVTPVCSRPELPCESVTFTQKLLATAAVGVPLTAPVEVFRTSPGGNAPLLTENLYGATPPAALMKPE